MLPVGLGLASGKYDAVISNVGVTEQRKEKFDFSTYRQGLRIIVGAGTNQERILLKWNDENIAAGLKPLELQYYDDEATRLIALSADWPMR